MKVEEPIDDYIKLNPDGLYTYWDYLKWKFEDRVELIKGKIRKMSPAAPNRRHQTLVGSLYLHFARNIKGPDCKVYLSPFDVRLPIPKEKKDSTVVQPDLCVVCDPSKLDDLGCNGAPDLVVEILSPGNTKHEMDTKFSLYEEAGVKEYWIVQNDDTILIFTLQDGKFIGLKPVTRGGDLASPLFTKLNTNTEVFFTE